MKKEKHLVVMMGMLVLALVCGGCQPNWEFHLTGLGDEDILINYQLWEEYAEFGDGDNVPLEQVLYGKGARIITRITIVDEDGEDHSYPWGDVAGDIFLSKKGKLSLSPL